MMLRVRRACNGRRRLHMRALGGARLLPPKFHLTEVRGINRDIRAIARALESSNGLAQNDDRCSTALPVIA